MTFVLSDSTINDYGFWVDTYGIDLTRFRSNPIMLWMHNRATWGRKDEVLPIGYWTNIRTEGDQLLADAVFDDNDSFAQTIKQKVESGILKAASAGLQPLAWSEAPEDLRPGQSRPTMKRCMLVEASICDIGSNANALRLYNSQHETISLSLDEGKCDIPLLSNLSGFQNPKDLTNPKNSQKQNSMKKVLIILGLSDDATEEIAVEAIKQLKNEHQVTVVALTSEKGKNTELMARLTLMETFRVDALINEALAARKIIPAQKEVFTKLATANYDNVKALFDTMPDNTQKLYQFATGAQSGINGVDELLKARENWTFQDWQKKDGKGLERLKTEHPETYQQLRNKLAS
jgi:hypothetical protein